MIRVLLFLIVVALLAVGGVWLAERPGIVAVSWMGYAVETSVLVALLAIVTAFAAILFLWWLVSGLWRMPDAIARTMWHRRRDRIDHAVSRGLLAIAAGDMVRGRRHAAEARKLAPEAPLTLLLTAQTAQLEGDVQRANAAFRAMLTKPETRLLGVRGLFASARREKNREAARRLAQEAFEMAPAAAWSSRALIEFQGTERDWTGALETLARLEREGALDRETARRQRAVLLTAQALDRTLAEPETAARYAEEAFRLAPDLVPAAVIAARHAIELGDIKRAVRILERAWKHEPHPELAEVYAHVRPGDSTHDRLERIRSLVRIRANHEEGLVALARAAVDAREWREAREALAPLLRGRPQARVCALMAEIELEEHGDEGRSREWLARALRASPDPAWTADGFVSDRWLPVSPVTGALDAFRWKVPVEEIGGPAIEGDGEALAREALRPPPARTEPAEPAEPRVEITPAAAASDETVADPVGASQAAAPAPVPEAEPVTAAVHDRPEQAPTLSDTEPAHEPERTPVAAEPSEQPEPPREPERLRPTLVGNGSDRLRPLPGTLPVPAAEAAARIDDETTAPPGRPRPDDPGVSGEAPPARRFGIF